MPGGGACPRHLIVLYPPSPTAPLCQSVSCHGLPTCGMIDRQHVTMRDAPQPTSSCDSVTLMYELVKRNQQRIAGVWGGIRRVRGGATMQRSQRDGGWTQRKGHTLTWAWTPPPGQSVASGRPPPPLYSKRCGWEPVTSGPAPPW